MSKKKTHERETDKLNIALSGIESCLAIASTFAENKKAKEILANASLWCDQARAALSAIKFHTSAI